MAEQSGEENTLAYPEGLAARYAPTRLLGRGGMGSVHEAMDRQLGRLVAVKLIDPRFTRSDDIARFVREGRVLATLNHPRVVRVLDAGEFGGTPYLVMEFLEGRVLERAIVNMHGRRLDVLALLDAMLDALEYVHTRGIVHRDIKPGNVILHAQRGPVVVDFGLAAPSAPTTLLTSAGTVVGTIAYMAPEMVKGQDATARCDIFATGLVGIEALTGVDVHDTKDVDTKHMTSAILSSLMSGAYHSAAAAALRPHGKLGAVLLRAIAPEPSARFASAREMRDALAASASETAAPRAPRAARAAQRRSETTVPMRPLRQPLARRLADWRTAALPGALAAALVAMLVMLVPRWLPGRSADGTRRDVPLPHETARGASRQDGGAGAPSGARPASWPSGAPATSVSGAPGGSATALAGGSPDAAGDGAQSVPGVDPIEPLVRELQMIEAGHEQKQRQALAQRAIERLRHPRAGDGLPAPLTRLPQAPGEVWTADDQHRYERAFWRYELAVMARLSAPERERCRQLLPEALRPGDWPVPEGRVFVAALGGTTLAMSRVEDAFFGLDSHIGFLRKAKAKIELDGLARAHRAWIVLRAGAIDPDVVVWATVEREHEHSHDHDRDGEHEHEGDGGSGHDRAREDGGAGDRASHRASPGNVPPPKPHRPEVGLVVPEGKAAGVACHSVPVSFLADGRCEIKVELDAVASGEHSIRGLEAVEVILAP